MDRIKAFTDSVKRLIESTKRLYGENTYLPLVDILFVR
jgi:hypothetical protein